MSVKVFDRYGEPIGEGDHIALSIPELSLPIWQVKEVKPDMARGAPPNAVMMFVVSSNKLQLLGGKSQPGLTIVRSNEQLKILNAGKGKPELII